MPKFLYMANAARWFDRVNGNTYHSVRITRNEDGATLVCPFQYGYGDHYRQTALDAMATNGWLPEKYQGRHANGSSHAYAYEMENDYPIYWTVSDGSKRDCVANGNP